MGNNATLNVPIGPTARDAKNVATVKMAVIVTIFLELVPVHQDGEEPYVMNLAHQELMEVIASFHANVKMEVLVIQYMDNATVLVDGLAKSAPIHVLRGHMD